MRKVLESFFIQYRRNPLATSVRISRLSHEETNPLFEIMILGMIVEPSLEGFLRRAKIALRMGLITDSVIF
jgi:hypothetical protein